MTLRRLVVGIGLVVVLGFLAIQLVPYGRDHTNPPVLSEPSWDSAATRATAVAACFDCHSNQAVWPWYSNIAPMSWLIQHDVEEGRQALNWSEWGHGQEGGESAEAVSEGQMPPFSYTLTHLNATLSAADRAAFIRGLVATFGGGN
ncbi:MAG: heme-binding domain-containing protein [Candidatus Limnocylindria bacterium]